MVVTGDLVMLRQGNKKESIKDSFGIWYNISVTAPILVREGSGLGGIVYILYRLCHGKRSSLLCMQMVRQ